MAETLGKRLKELRQSNGYSQADIAEHLNISRQSISRWENDLSYPDIDNLKLLSEYYELSIDELLKETKQLQHEINEKTEQINENIKKIEDKQEKLKHLKQPAMVLDESWILLILSVLSITIAPFGLISIPLILWRNKKENQFKQLILLISLAIFIYNLYVLYVWISTSVGIGVTTTIE